MIRVAGILLAFIGTTGVATAQQGQSLQSAPSQAVVNAGCSCAQPLATFLPRGATVQPQAGEVLISRTAGTAPATPSSALAVGDRVITGEDGSALVTFPSGCQISLQKQSLVTVRQVEDYVCAVPVQAGSAFGAQGSGNSQQNGPLQGFLFATSVIGGGAIIQSLSDSNGNPVSMPPD